MKTESGLQAGFIGLGAMGAPMAHNLYLAGRLAAVWNRTPAKLDAFLAGHEVARADSPAAVARAAPVVIVCVSADDDLLDVVVRLLPGLGGDSVVVDGGAAGNWFLEHRGETMVGGRYGEGFKLELHHKDLEICRRMAGELGVALPVVEMTLVHYRRLMQAGFGEEDISALFREKRALFARGAEEKGAAD